MANFPDIDDGPEVYESSDIEDEEKIVANQESRDPNIVTGESNIQDARGRFEAEELADELTLVDFLGGVSRSLGRSGFSVSRFETRRQKLSRIAAELESLDESGGNDEVEALSSQLQRLMDGSKGELDNGPREEIAELFRGVTDEVTGCSIDHSKENTKSNVANTKKDVAMLEERLRRVEASIGANGEDKNLGLVVKDLRRKVDVVYDPKFQFQPVHDEIKALDKELEQLVAKKRRAEIITGQAPPAAATVPFEGKINMLFDKLPEFEKVNETVPHILKRLRTLNEVHSETAMAVSTITNLGNILDLIKGEMGSWTAALDSMNTSLDAREDAFISNMQVFEKKLQSMEDRVSELGK